MKKILLILCLLTIKGYANRVAFYGLSSTAEISGAYSDLTNVGGVSYVTTPGPCTLTTWGGTYVGGKYFKVPTNLNTTMGSMTAYEITYHCGQLNSLANNPVVWSTTDGLTFMQVLNDGTLRICLGNVSHILKSAVGAVTTGVNYTFAIRVQANGTRVLKINGSQVDTDAFGGTLPAFTEQDLGRYYGSTTEETNGYLQGWEVDNTTPSATITPSITPTSTTSPTFTRTATPAATNTFTPSPVATATKTITPTRTSTPTPTYTSTYCPSPVVFQPPTQGLWYDCVIPDIRARLTPSGTWVPLLPAVGNDLPHRMKKWLPAVQQIKNLLTPTPTWVPTPLTNASQGTQMNYLNKTLGSQLIPRLP